MISDFRGLSNAGPLYNCTSLKRYENFSCILAFRQKSRDILLKKYKRLTSG